VTIGDEHEGTGALDLALANFDDDISDPTAFTAGFGGFGVWGNEDETKEMVEGEGWWTDAFDTMFV
jgi:hypothetical protein